MGCMFFSNFSCQPYVINIQLRNTDNIYTDLYILLKPQSELGYLGSERRIVNCLLPRLPVGRRGVMNSPISFFGVESWATAHV